MSTSRTTKSARKPPQQARAKVTVEAILDAAIRVLDREGAEAATTSRIAQVAGVSVGTLYQYFGNRDSIIDALQDREFERAVALLNEKLTLDALVSEHALARAVVGGLLDLYRASPGLHRVLAIDGLRVTPTERVQAFDRKVVETLRAFFDAVPFAVVRENRHAAAFVLYQSVRASMLAFILEEPAGLTDEILVDELSHMVVAHLVGTK